MSSDNSASEAHPDLSFLDSPELDSSIDNANDPPQKDEVAMNLSPDSEDNKKREHTEKHARAWAAKIIAQKATLDDIPENHKYLVPEIQKFLGQPKKEEPKVEPKKSSVSSHELVQFELRKEKLQQLDITATQAKTLEQRFKYLRSKSFGLVEALDEAISFAGVNINRKEKDTPEIKPGGAPEESKIRYEGTEDPNKMSRKELQQYQSHLAKVSGK
nr:MAG: hypothetical protein [Podoviridae sp. ctka020]